MLMIGVLLRGSLFIEAEKKGYVLQLDLSLPCVLSAK